MPDGFWPHEEDDPPDIDDLIGLVEEQRALLITVATGGPAINTVNAEYQKRQRRLNKGLQAVGLKNPIKWADLWRWHGRWSDGSLPTYASRRSFIGDLLDPLIEQLEAMQQGHQVEDWGEPSDESDWAGLEARVLGLRGELRDASSLDDLQDVGRRTREILIDLGNLVFTEDMIPSDEQVPGRNDSKARIGYYLQSRLSGKARKVFGQFLRATYDLAQYATHSDNLTRAEALASAQAAMVLVRALDQLHQDGGEE